jgi:anti-sigma factor RsiW
MKEEKHCRDLVSSLSDYIDGELNEKLCAELEQHLEHCHNCQVVVNTLKKTIELYRKTSDDEQLSDPARKELYARLNIEDFIRS